MYNWNAHMRGAGFPRQSQQLMQIPGAHLPQMAYQLPQHQWAQQQQHGMGMMMTTHNWSPVAQPTMYSPHRLPHGHMTGQATTVMGGVGPAPPSQPPPPLPAEPPPSPKALPPPPPPNQKDAHTPTQPEKNTKLDQAEREQSSFAEGVTVPDQARPPQSPGPDQPRPPQSPAPSQPRPPQSPAPGQPRPPQSPAPVQPKPPPSPAPSQPKPPQSPAPGQPKPPQSPAPGQPKPPQSPASNQANPGGPASNQANPGGPAPNQVNPQGSAPNQVKPRGPATNQVNPRGPAPNQVNPRGSVPNQVNPRGSVPNQVNPRGSVPNQVNPRGPAPNQVNPRGPAPNQVNPRGSVPNQVNPQGPAPNQVNPRGPAPNQVNPRGPGPNQVNPRGPAPNQVNPRGPGPNQVNPRGPAISQLNSQGSALTQTDPYQHLAPGQLTPQGQALGMTNPIYSAASGHLNSASVPESDKLPHQEKTVPDPVLVAELEKVKSEETLFMEQYKQWKQQYDEWRQQNQNHPNKQQFEQYLDQWRTYEQQMEIRRKDIEVQKQNIEDKLSSSQVSPEVSQLGPHWEGTLVQSIQVENTAQDMSGNPCWDRDGNQVHFRENQFVELYDQSLGYSFTDPSQRCDISKRTGPAMAGRVNTFSDSSGNRKIVSSAVHHSSYNVEEDKGEEDMNIEDDEECGGIIESGQRVDNNVWPGKLTTNSDSYQQHSDVGWNSWNQGPDGLGRSQRGGQGDSLNRGVKAESTGATGLTGQRGVTAESTGATGLTGQRGVTAESTGATGLTGQRGVTAGSTGATGLTGQRGVTAGSTGATGLTGQRGVTAESTGATGLTGQRGTVSQESGSLRGMGRGSSNNDDTDLPSMDSDLRLRPTGGSGGFGQPDDEYGGEEFNGDQNDEFGDGETGNVDDIYSGRGGFMTHSRPWQRGSDNDFQRGRGGGDLRGRGGEFLRGRGGDFQMGRGDFHRGRGGDLYRGWGGNFRGGMRGDFQGGMRGDFQGGMRGDFQGGIRGDFQGGMRGDFQGGMRGDFQGGMRGDFQGGMRGDYQGGMRGDFQGGMRGDFQGGMRGDFQGGRRDDFQMGMGDAFMNEGGGNSLGHEDFEHGRGPPRGRGGLPSLLSLDFNESLRHPLAGYDQTGKETHGGEQDADYGTALEGQGQRVVREREAQRYLCRDDEDDSSCFLPLSRREIGIGGRGDMDGGRGRGGFRSDLLDRDNQSDLSLRLRGQENTNISSFNDGQRFLQQSRGGTGGSTREAALFCDSEEVQIPGELNLRDNMTGSMKRREMDPDRPGSNWENQMEDNVAAHYDRPRNQQNSETAPGGGPLADRGRGRRMPDEVEPEVKKGRFSLDDEREENSRHMAPYPGDPYRALPGDPHRALPGDPHRALPGDPHRALPGDPHRAPPGDMKSYRDYRDPYIEQFPGRPSHGFDRQISDRFGTRSSVFEPPLERRPMLPPESIDYGHGGVGKDSTVVKPAEVIDYGHGQSTEVKSTTLVLDRERMPHAALADRTYPDVLRGGAEVRASRDGHELAMKSELIDRETSLRRPETSVRGTNPNALSKYGLRGEQLGEEAGKGAVPGGLRGWSGEGGDDNFDSDLRGDRASTRDRFHEEDDLRRGHRTARFSSRDDRAGKLFEGQDDDRSSLREHGPSSVSRHDYSVTDDYYSRRGGVYGSRLTDTYADRGSEYTHDPDQVPDEDDYVAQPRDGRYSSSAGGDVYSRDDRARGHALDRDSYSRAMSPPARSTTPLKTSTAAPVQSKPEIVKVEDLLCPPNRESRPSQIVTIIRGLPGSGKTYTSKLLREKEISCGGAAPRMLCLDDYFMLEMEREVAEVDTGKKVKKRVLEYEYEQALEETYRQSLLRSFKKTVDDGFFPFIIVDATNEKVVHFSEFWSYAKSKGFQVYVGELNADVPTCIQRNIHHWTEWDIEKVKNSWEPLPSHYIRLDLRWLLQEDSIPEVIMEDTQADDEADKDAEDEDEESDLKEVIKSRWELDTSGETLDKLDGIRVSKKHIAEHQSLNDYLQLDQMDDDYFSRESLPGKKRVRWADLEEKKSQSRRRNLGFIVGQTQQDWERITDDDLATKALNQTKYFYKN